VREASIKSRLRFPFKGTSSWHTHQLCVACLGVEHAQSVLEGADCEHCMKLSMRMLRSHWAFFEEDGTVGTPRGVGPAVAEARWRLAFIQRSLPLQYVWMQLWLLWDSRAFVYYTTYINDWLILSQSEHKDVVLSHLKMLGVAAQHQEECALITTFLGVAIFTAVNGVYLGQSLTVKQFQTGRSHGSCV